MATALMGVIDGTKTMKEGFLDMAKVVLQAIAQIIVKMIAMKAISAMGFGFADGGVIPRANGGYMFGGKQPKGYRSGGVVTEPTYLVGEGKYNEAVVPLPDGRSIPVMMKGGSGGNANVTVNISADGQTTDNISSDNGEQGAQLGRAISAAVQEEMHKQQRPGGILSPYGG
jgi:phage-related minor tail protein